MVLHLHTAGVLFRDPLSRLFRVLVGDGPVQNDLLAILYVNGNVGARKSSVFLESALNRVLDIARGCRSRVALGQLLVLVLLHALIVGFLLIGVVKGLRSVGRILALVRRG